MEQIVFLTSNAFHVYVVYRFASRIFFTYSFSKHSVYAALCYYVLNSFCALCFEIPVFNLFSSIIGLCILIIPCNDKWSKRAFFVAFVTSLGFVCDVLIYTFFDNPGYLLSAGIITNFILFAVELGNETFLLYKFKSEIEKKEWLVLCSVPVASVVMLFLLDMNQGTSQELCLSCAVVCFLINIIIFRFYATLSSYYDQLLDAHQNEFHLKMYENRIIAMEVAEKQMNSFRHDLNNHISVLKEMAYQDNNLKIISFLDKMSDSLRAENRLAFTKHSDFNLLINYLYNKAIVSGIESEIEIDIPNTFQCNIYDMNIILSNLFDNAVEAAALTEEKLLKLSLKYFKGIFQIKLVNSHNNSFKFVGNVYYSSKQDSESHGLGVKNVERIVEKYHGSVEYTHSDYLFYATAILYV